jgi:DNA repair exonuclease SbcCD ATPase subunit
VKEELAREKKRLEEKIEQQHTKSEDLKSKEQRLSILESRLSSAKLAKRLAERFEKAIETRRRDVLKEIEHRALYYYERMTDQHDYDSVRIDPESYVVQVHPRNLAEHIPAMRDGGGHQTILALAVRLALLETLRFRCLLILDEPTYGVDADNLPQVAEYLGETSRLLSQTILVTHHDICEEEAANIIMVSRGSDGASHVQAKY